jgi:hypothetical protein
MAKATDHEHELLKAIKRHKWMRWSHIDWEALPFRRSTAYNAELDKLDTIKEAFSANRARSVDYLLQKWILSENPTTQIAAMRMICEDEERVLLNQKDNPQVDLRQGEKATITLPNGTQITI